MHQLILQQDGETFIWHFYYERNPRYICAVTSICLLRVAANVEHLAQWCHYIQVVTGAAT